MSEISREWVKRCATVPREHQIVGVEKLLKHSYFGIFDEPGAGKTKQVIDASQVLFTLGVINRVIVVTLATIRDEWFNPQRGQLQEHCWDDIPNRVTLYHKKILQWRKGPRTDKDLRWVITNYDYYRGDLDREKFLRKFCGPKTLIVFDESSALKTNKSKQSKTSKRLRKLCGRVVLLNGTPIDNNPLDMLSQGAVLSTSILGTRSVIEFRERYCEMGGWQGRQILAWKNLDDLKQRFAPYVIRRLKKDCLDLPPKLPPTAVTVTLTEKTWRKYAAMRDELIVWLSQERASVASHTITKLLRLSQITSGFVGGVAKQETLDFGDLPEIKNPNTFKELQTIGEEKRIAFTQWFARRLTESNNLGILVWSRFREETIRLYQRISESYTEDELSVGLLIGGTEYEQRKQLSLDMLHPKTAPKDKPVIVFGTAATGGVGLNLSRASHVVYVSNSLRLFDRVQSEERVHRPGQTLPVSYTDFIAEGPTGQQTIDSRIIQRLRENRDLADETTSAWVDYLTTEREMSQPQQNQQVTET